MRVVAAEAAHRPLGAGQKLQGFLAVAAREHDGGVGDALDAGVAAAQNNGVAHADLVAVDHGAARFARSAPFPFAVDWACDTGRASRVLGFTARVPLAEGVDETLRWYRDRGLLDSLLAGAALRAKEAS